MTHAMKKTFFLLIFLIVITLSSLFLVKAQPTTVNLSVSTDKTSYCGFTPVTIMGTLQQNSVSASDGLVGLQVQDSTGNTIVIRTLRTGASNPQSLPANIASAFLSDNSEHPQTSIQAGSLSCFTINLVNNDNAQLSMLVTVNLYDSAGIPIGQMSEPCSLTAGQSASAILSVPIPAWAHSGVAYGYFNAYSDWPSNGGVPLSPEQSCQFSITNGLNGPSNVSSTSANQGSYSLTFRLPTMGPADATYTVYASTSYSGEKVTKTCTFTAVFADFYDNGYLSSSDFFCFVNAFIACGSGSSNWTKTCDMNQDGTVDGQDFFLFVQCYLAYWSAYEN